jgi:hypothetical protein
MKRALILIVSLAGLTACDQMGGSRGDSGGMGSQTDKAFERGSGAAQKGPKDPDYRSGQSASEPGRNAKPSNPGSPSGGTAGWPEKNTAGNPNPGAAQQPNR